MKRVPVELSLWSRARRRIPAPPAYDGRLASWAAALSLALAAYAFVALLWLAPLVRHVDSAVLYGPTDSVGTLADYWAAQRLGVSYLELEHNPYNGAPEGYPLSRAITVANALQPVTWDALEDVVGPVGAWNVLTIAGFVLSALGMFALLWRLRFGFATALLGGYAFGFGPWMFNRAYEGHAAMQHLWVLPLLFLACLHVHRTRGLVGAAAIGALLGLALYIHSYVGLMAAVLAAAFAAVELVTRAGRLRTLVLAAIAAVTTVASFSPVLWLYASAPSSVSRSVGQPLSDVVSGGAGPLDYLLPSNHHPLFGALRPERLGGEHVVFWGYAVIVGAVVGAVLALRRRDADDERRYAALLAVCVGVAGLGISLKPVFEIAGVSVRTPSYLLWELAPFWRAYSRFGVLVGLALIVLAAFALEALLRQRRGAWLALAAATVVAFELAVSAPVPTWRTNAMPEYVEWLREHPGGTVAQYPLPIEEGALAFGAAAHWDVVKHGHPLFALWGGNNGGTREEAIRIVASDPGEQSITGPVLAAADVTYALVHDGVYRELGARPPVVNPDHFELAAELDDVRVFRVVAEPADLEEVLAEQDERIALARAHPPVGVGYGGGFNEPETFEDGREWRWMTQGGRIDVTPPFGGRYLVEFEAFANGAPRSVDLRRDDEVLITVRVEAFRQAYRLGPFQLDGGTTLTLAADPGPQPLDASRRGSIFVSPVAVAPAPDFYGRLNPEPGSD